MYDTTPPTIGQLTRWPAQSTSSAMGMDHTSTRLMYVKCFYLPDDSPAEPLKHSCWKGALLPKPLARRRVPLEPNQFTGHAFYSGTSSERTSDRLSSAS
jgi:hypothetical protein